MTDRSADLRSPGRIGSRELARIRERLSVRDMQILTLVAEHRFLSTVHIQRLCFADHATPSAGIRACNRVLERLLRLRVLARLDRQIGGAVRGSQAHSWCLDIIGDRLTRAGGPRQRYHEPTVTFLTHTLAVAEARVGIVEAARAGNFELLDVAIESDAARPFIGPGGAHHVLRPDLFVRLGTPEYEDHWQIEIDLGSETIRTLLAKCEQYARYANTLYGADEVAPRVLWQLPSHGRAQRLTHEILQHRALDSSQFVIVTPDGLIKVLTDPTPAGPGDENSASSEVSTSSPNRA